MKRDSFCSALLQHCVIRQPNESHQSAQHVNAGSILSREELYMPLLVGDRCNYDCSLRGWGCQQPSIQYRSTSSNLITTIIISDTLKILLRHSFDISRRANEFPNGLNHGSYCYTGGQQRLQRPPSFLCHICVAGYLRLLTSSLS